LHQTEVDILDAMGVFDAFKKMGNSANGSKGKVLPTLEAGCPMLAKVKRRLERIKRLRKSNLGRPEVTDMKRRLEQAMILYGQSSSCLHVIFTLDFSKSKKRLLQEFDAWLKLDENKRRLSENERDPKGTSPVHKDRLKDLATWRLYDDLQTKDLFKDLSKSSRSKFDRLIAFTSAHRKSGRAFHDARRGQSHRSERLEEAQLYGDQQQCLNAIQRSRDWLANMIPEG
jgi:hypothetical protein